jgi:FtsP/CotA-like multicopper oxidase with cupredoxin domain
MIVSRRRVSGVEKFHYLINQTFQGPTIIAKQYGIVVIDVSNEMDENTAIHFHGIRQRNVPWMDGAGNVTQYPIQAYGRFR